MRRKKTYLTTINVSASIMLLGVGCGIEFKFCDISIESVRSVCNRIKRVTDGEYKFKVTKKKPDCDIWVERV